MCSPSALTLPGADITNHSSYPQVQTWSQNSYQQSLHTFEKRMSLFYLAQFKNHLLEKKHSPQSR